MDEYLSESKEQMLKFVARKKELPEVEDLDPFKKHLKEKRSQRLEKPLCGRFLIDTEKVSTERT